MCVVVCLWVRWLPFLVVVSLVSSFLPSFLRSVVSMCRCTFVRLCACVAAYFAARVFVCWLSCFCWFVCLLLCLCVSVSLSLCVFG